MTITQIDLYNILKTKVGEKEAQALVGFVESEVAEKFNDKKDIFSSKKDLSDLRGDLKSEIKDAKVDTIKWIVGMSILQIATLVAIMKAFIK